MSIVLRPLSTSELLDRAFFLYRNNFVVFVCISAISHLPVLALRLANSARVAARIRVSRPAELTVLLMATFLAMAVSHAATTVAVSDLHLDHAASVRSAYRRARRSLFRVIWISFVVMLVVPCLIAVPAAILVGMVLLPLGLARLGGGALPGLILLTVGFGAATYWWLARALVVPVTVIEGTGRRESMDRSLILTVNRRGQILLICILVVVLTWGMTALFQLPAVATGRLYFVHGRLDNERVVGGSYGGWILRWRLTGRAIANHCAHVGILRRPGTQGGVRLRVDDVELGRLASVRGSRECLILVAYGKPFAASRVDSRGGCLYVSFSDAHGHDYVAVLVVVAFGGAELAGGLGVF